VYIIPRLETDVAVVLEYRQLHQPRPAARAAHARSAGGCIARPVRGAQEEFAKGVEKIAFIPIEFQRTMCTPVEISMHPAIETNGEGGNHFSVSRYIEAHTVTALYEFTTVTDDTPPMRRSHS
jgi:hypothetical protein